LRGVEPACQRIKLGLPILAVTVDPDRGGQDRCNVDAAAANPAASLLADQSRPHQHLDVAGHRLEGNWKWGRELGYQQRPVTEALQNLAPCGVGQCEKHRVEQRLFRGRGVGGWTDLTKDCGARRHAGMQSTSRLIVNELV
jgi:hypothetical protein